jgi:predicted ATP-binding protein involved in virulence
MKDKGFKIIALKPLKGCHPDYLKILTENQFYFFYNNYIIDKRDKISVVETIPIDFYNVNNIQVNISAIVGKNGSGKSTIVELLLRAINNLAELQHGIIAELTKIPRLKVDLYFHTDRYYKLRVSNSAVQVFKYDRNGNKLPKPIKDFPLKQFFYTIAVNYSHYAHNIRDLKGEVNWLNGLFHKNDGYQTPLAINPMRTDGNIDINNENHLVKSRLIGNLLRPVRKVGLNFRKVTENLEATSLRLSLNKSKRDSILYQLSDENNKNMLEIRLSDLEIDQEEILKKLDNAFYFGYEKLNKKKYKIALDYLLYKMVSIATKYPDYLEYFSKEKKIFYPNKVELFVKELSNDQSHITFKLRQTINFIKYKHIKLEDRNLNLSDLSEKINRLETRKKETEIAEFVPPPIFNTEIILKGVDTKKRIEFRMLSSGEKQMIYSISSILYHLINLNSIRQSRRRTRYDFVNIILEEIELYFHPEMQRTYIYNILESLRRLRLWRIRAINFCFVTHSPFILSDIPDSNILFLNEKGLPDERNQQVKTFGGNIHDLLKDKFFLEKGYMGEVAKIKINSAIDFLNSKIGKESNEQILVTDEWTEHSIKKLIEIIGEPLIRDSLRDLYLQAFVINNEAQIDREISLLKAHKRKFK